MITMHEYGGDGTEVVFKLPYHPDIFPAIVDYTGIRYILENKILRVKKPLIDIARDIILNIYGENDIKKPVKVTIEITFLKDFRVAMTNIGGSNHLFLFNFPIISGTYRRQSIYKSDFVAKFFGKYYIEKQGIDSTIVMTRHSKATLEIPLLMYEQYIDKYSTKNLKVRILNPKDIPRAYLEDRLNMLNAKISEVSKYLKELDNIGK